MSDDPHDRPRPQLGAVRPGQDPTYPGRPAVPPPIRDGRPTGPPPLPPHPPPHLQARPVAPRAQRPDPRLAAPEAFQGPRTIYQRRAESPGRSGLARVGRAVAYALLGIVGLAVAALAFLLLAPPTDLIRDRLVAEVKARTGRDLVISGDAGFTFAPKLGVKLRGVMLSAPSTMPGAPLLKAEEIDVTLALLPLVTRDVRIERLVLVKPIIDLRVDQSGRRSWDFADAEPLRQALPVRYAQAAPRGTELRRMPPELQDFAKHASPGLGPADRLASLQALSLGDVRFVDGAVRYSDARTGVVHEARGIDARLSLKDIAGPLDIKGQFVWGGQRLAGEARIGSIRDALDARTTVVRLSLAGTPLKLGYEGQVTPGAQGLLDGRLTLSAPSVSGLARLLQLPLPGLEGVGEIGLEGQIKTSPATVALSNAALRLGDLAASGAVTVSLAGARPSVKTALRIAVLDLNRLSGLDIATRAAPQPAAGAAPPAAPQPPAAPATPTAPGSIDDLLKQLDRDDAKPAGPAGPTGTQVRGFTRRAGEPWSQEPFDLSLLRHFDIDGRFEIGRLLWQEVKIGQTQLTVQLAGGLLRASVTEAQLYSGRGTGLVSLDVRQPLAVLGVNLSTDGVATAGLLKDAFGLDVVDGRGRLLVAVSAKGISERDLVGTLAGKAELHVADGAIIGWNAADLSRQLGKLQIPSFARRPEARTPFTVLSGSFPIANGVARTQDLKLEGPSIHATGSGVINLVDRNTDLTIKPRLGGTGSGLDVPLRIAGNWGNIAVMPDIKGSQTLQKLGRQVREGDIDNAVRGVLGDGPEAKEKAAKAKEMLRKFLRP